jgi:hypothetical protein
MTGEQRIQATRDERANDRALADWARDNAANLRALAGQVTALDGLDDTTRASVERIHDALGDDDTAALLDPLSRAGEDLRKDHPRLAKLIRNVLQRHTRHPDGEEGR